MINGQFNFNVYSEFREAYRDIEPGQVSTLVVDLKNTEYIDSAALGMLLLLEEHFKDLPVNIRNCSEYTLQLLQVANFDKRFNVST